jgi:hypothetical protein
MTPASETLAGTGTARYSGLFGRYGYVYIADNYRIREIIGLLSHRRWDCRDDADRRRRHPTVHALPTTIRATSENPGRPVYSIPRVR